MIKEQELIVVEELNQLIDKSRDLREEEFYTIFTIHEVQNIETVLNMLKENSAEIEQKNTELAEKNAEIEKLKKVLDEKYIFVQGARTVYGRLMSLDKEDIVKDDLALRNEIYHHIEDKEKKDKIIDLMAEQLAGLTIWNNEKEEPLILADKEEVIKYFEKKRQNVAERKSEEWKLK